MDPRLNLDPSARGDVSAWLRLTLVPGVQPRHHRALLAAFGSPQQALAASHASVTALCGLVPADALAKGARSTMVDAALAWLAPHDNHLVTLADADYPRSLLETPDPPSVLYVRGKLARLNAPCFAIVGSRNATLQGARDAQAFAAALSQAGLCIVSGLAAGIDAAAHRGGIAHRGSSIAVMGTGADRLYPASNRGLADAITSTGCLVSEFPLGTPPEKMNFPRRNRLISGLSRGVLVVEAALKSGSLITARSALEQGREVFAVPGSIHSPLAKGCHDLIKEGATLVQGVDDIMAELGMTTVRNTEPPASNSASADPLLEAMGYAPISIDRISQLTGLGAAKLAASLSRLEIDGRIAPLAGGLFQRIESAR